MSDLELFVLIAMSYLLTGVALTGYDFSAPPLYSKGYVIQKKYSTAIVIWFIWPLTAFLDARDEQKCGRGFFRYIGRVLLVAFGMGGLWVHPFTFTVSQL